MSKIKIIIATAIISSFFISCASTKLNKVDTSAYKYEYYSNWSVHQLGTNWTGEIGSTGTETVIFNTINAENQINNNTLKLTEYISTDEQFILNKKIDIYNNYKNTWYTDSFNSRQSLSDKYKSIIKYQTKLANKYEIKL